MLRYKTGFTFKCRVLLRIMHTHVSVHVIQGIIIPVVCNHYTHVECTSLFFPKTFGQKSVQYTWQNMGKSCFQRILPSVGVAQWIE